MATIECFEIEELASKVIPAMAFTLVDKEKLVRDQAFKAMELFIKKLEEYTATLPETVIEPTGPTTLPLSPNGSWVCVLGKLSRRYSSRMGHFILRKEVSSL